VRTRFVAYDLWTMVIVASDSKNTASDMPKILAKRLILEFLRLYSRRHIHSISYQQSRRGGQANPMTIIVATDLTVIRHSRICPQVDVVPELLAYLSY